MKIIMICGQGSVGKSTFVKRYFSNKQNIINISVDNIVKGNSFSSKYYDLYIQEIQKNINLYENTSKIITLDFSHDSNFSRADVLNRLKFNSLKIDFIAIGLHPVSFKDIVINHENRIGKKLSQEEVNRIKMVHEHFQPPSNEEFEKYNFNSIKTITLTNYLIK